MTLFALTLWTWEATGSVTTLALLGLFSQLPQIPTTLLAGPLVDYFDRKRLILLGDAIAALTTAAIGILHFTQSLQIWHLYSLAILAGVGGQIQTLAYDASVSLIVPKQQYMRANSMAAVVHYGASIVGPALAGFLYPIIDLSGIVAVDGLTFAVALLTLFAASIPSPQATAVKTPESRSDGLSFAQCTFGLHHIWRQPYLRTLMLVTLVFTFAHDLGGTLYSPMILARSGGSAETLASVSVIAGSGGVVGAALMTLWGGPRHRGRSMLAGYIGAGLSKLVFGLGRSLTIWLPAQACSSLNFPLLSSARRALWMERVAPEIQGRVFAANMLTIQIASVSAVLLAGPLADQILEPAMMTNHPLAQWLSLGFGRGPGAGMAVLYTASALVMLLAGIVGGLTPLAHNEPE